MQKLFFLIFAFLTAALSAAPPKTVPPAPPETKVFGILVHYRPQVGNSEKDRSHRVSGNRLKQRITAWDVDWVVPEKGDPFISTSVAGRLCSQYRKNFLVVACQPNRPLKISKHASSDEPEQPQEARAKTTDAKICNTVLEDEERGLAPLNKGKLTALWAQHQIGSDLVQPLLAKIPNAKRVAVGIYDSGFHVENLRGQLSPALKNEIETNPGKFSDPHPAHGGAVATDDFETSHGDLVANLVNSEHAKIPVGVGYLAEITQVVPTLYESDATKIPLDGIKLANVSLGWGDDPIASDGSHSGRTSTSLANKVFSALKERGTIVVFAAGNDYPKPVDSTSKHGILVGSSAPDGMASDFSQEDNDIAVLAPSDHLISDIGRDEKPKSFGGTSGAAPLVTGGLALPVSLLDGLTQEEAKLLLKLSSTPGLNARDTPQRNGAGILNQYRMARVAMALMNHWPANRQSLADPKTYDFTDEAKKKKQAAIELLGRPDCKEQKKGFAMLRESFFLNPNDRESAGKIAAIYRSLNRPDNAGFFERVGSNNADLAGEFKTTLGALKKGSNAEQPSYTSIENLNHQLRNLRGAEANALVGTVARDYPGLRPRALKTFAQWGNAEALREYATNSDPQVRADVGEAISFLSPKPSLELLRELAKDPDRNVAVASLIGATPLGFAAKPVFDDVLQTQLAAKAPDKGVMENLARGSWTLADKQNEFLRQFARSAPQQFLQVMNQIQPTSTFDPADLLKFYLQNGELSGDAISKFRRYVRDNDKKLSPEHRDSLVKALSEAYAGLPARQKGEAVGFLADLGKSGTDAVMAMFERGDAASRLPILRGLRWSDAKDEMKKLALRTLKENPTDSDNVATAISLVGAEQPETVLPFGKLPSAEVRKMLLREIPEKSSVVNTKEYANLVEESLQSPDEDLATNAGYAMGASNSKTLNQTGLAKLNSLPANLAKPFLIGAAANDTFRKDATDFALRNPSTREFMVEALLFQADRGNRGASAETDALLVEKNDVNRANFLDAFFHSTKAQKETRRLSDEAFLALASDWEARGFPAIAPDFVKKMKYSREAALKTIHDNYRRKTPATVKEDESDFE